MGNFHQQKHIIFGHQGLNTVMSLALVLKDLQHKFELNNYNLCTLYPELAPPLLPVSI